MAKISPVSGKYTITATIHIDGVVDRPDIIGAIFGQTEGLLGAQLELRELQRSGRIGRIEVNTTTKQGKTDGDIVIPSSLDKAETAIVAAALEIIERIGPCNSEIRVKSIEDIRITKRTQVIERAKELLRQMQDTVLPDSQEISDAVADSVRVMEIQSFGPEKLPCGPGITEGDEIIVVEGRADVLNLLKHGFKNAIAMNGSSVPPTLAELCKSKTVTAFVDGDRGGILNIKELIAVTEIDFVAKAPDGKEVEELTQKEIHKALRSRVTPDQIKGDLANKDSLRQRIDGRDSQNSVQKDRRDVKPQPNNRNDRNDRTDRNGTSDRPERNDRHDRNDRNDRNGRDRDNRERRTFEGPKKRIPTEGQLKSFKSHHEDLIGSHAAALLDKDNTMLGKLPLNELASTLEGLDNVYTVIMDGSLNAPLVQSLEKARVRFVVPSESESEFADSKVTVVLLE
jgi:DNA primase